MPWMSRATKRKLRRFVGWEKVKELGVHFVAHALRHMDALPDRFYLGCVELGTALLRSVYYVPGNPWRRACRHVAALGGGRHTGRAVYMGLVDRLAAVAALYVKLLRAGPEAVLDAMGFEEGSEAVVRSVAGKDGGGFLLLPHCIGGVLSAAYFARVVPTVIISRGPSSPRRAEIQRTFIERLGVELLVIDDMAKSTVARSILRVVKAGKFIVATTDLMKQTAESIPAEFFGQPIHLPSWPARFSAKTGRPVVAGYVLVADGGLAIRASAVVRGKDVADVTERWSRSFQEDILADPWDWAFLFDLRWGRLLSRAAVEGTPWDGAAPGAPASRPAPEDPPSPP